MKKFIGVVLLILPLLAAAKTPMEFTANDIFAACNINPNDTTFCTTMFLGVVSNALDMTTPSGAGYICPPAGTNPYQLIKIVRSELDKYPQIWHESVVTFAAITLRRYFPCATNK